MNTNQLKSFAREARNILIDGVKNRLLFWGFDANGQNTETLETIEGGYLFRGNIYDDTRIPKRWNALRIALQQNAKSADIAETAAYTWFNRLLAIKILEENNFDAPIVRFVEGTRIPLLLQNAKQGIHQLQGSTQAQLLQYLRDDNDEAAFALLLTDYCNRHPLLSSVFGRLDDFTEILLPSNLLSTNGFMALLNEKNPIAAEDYRNVELIGWLYQFYIADRKDEVFKGFKENKKARAEDIPAATQIFTPKWIVQYMVQNTIGRIYLDQNPDSELKKEMHYLVEPSQNSTLDFRLSDFQLSRGKIIDPACGSGHILVTALEWLVKMYQEEGYNTRQAVEMALKNNIFGLDIDERAAQLSRFALLLQGAILGNKDILSKGSMPNVHAMPNSNTGFESEEVSQFLGDTTHTGEWNAALDTMLDAPTLGSVMKLQLSPEARTQAAERLDALQADFDKALLGLDTQGVFLRIKPFVTIALMLTDRYEAIAANPPYMGQKSMNDTLKKYLEVKYPMSKSDLFAVFMESCNNLLTGSGRYGMINQHSWMFLSSYEALRKKLLNEQCIENMLHLGPRTFEELSGEVVQSTAFIIQKQKPTTLSLGTYFRLTEYKSSEEKHQAFLERKNRFTNIKQANFHKIPGNATAYWVSEKVTNVIEKNNSFDTVSIPRKGLVTTDDNYFLKQWFEVSFLKMDTNNELGVTSNKKWIPITKGGSMRKWYGNNEYCINWLNNGKELKDFIVKKYNGGSFTKEIRSEEFYFKKNINWNGITSGIPTFRYSDVGFIFSSSGPSTFFRDDSIINYSLGLLNSVISKVVLEIMSPTLSVLSGHIAKIPFITNEDHKATIEMLSKSCISISKRDWDSRETSWDFEQSPLCTQCTDTLAEAYANWATKVSADFWQLHQNEEALNRLFIDIYGLADELSPEVAFKDVTILQDEIDSKALIGLSKGEALPIKQQEVMAQLLSYMLGCYMGRYRLGKSGLHIAHPEANETELFTYMVEVPEAGLEPFEIDTDAIIPIMGKAGNFADDATRLLSDFLRLAYGENSLTSNLNFLQNALGESAEDYLCNPKKWWTWHTRQYNKKPIYWLFASSQKSDAAFKCLVYLHRMDKYTVQKVRLNYLHPFQSWIANRIEQLRSSEANLSREEQKQLDRYERQVIECQHYDEVLKTLSQQEDYLSIDLDDGVTVNILKYKGAVVMV